MLTDSDWASIYSWYEKASGKTQGQTLMSKVIKRDEANKLIWIAELGDQPIPLLAFDYEVKYYDTDAAGAIIEKKAKVQPMVPEVGDHVFVAMERGTRRLPRCLGKVQSQNYIRSSLDEA